MQRMTRSMFPVLCLLVACDRAPQRPAHVEPDPVSRLVESPLDAGAPPTVDAAALAAVVLPLPAPIRETLNRDLAVIRNPKAWLHRSTFLGWTAADRAVVEVITCDADSGGGRGPYCELDLCDVEPSAQSLIVPPCKGLWVSNFNSDAERVQLDAETIAMDLAGALTDLLPLHDGRRGSIAEATLQTKTSSQSIDVVLTLRGAHGSYLAHHLDLTGMLAPLPSISGVKVTSVVHAADRPCTLVLGHATVHGSYEGVPTETPQTLANVVCTD